MFLIDPTAPTLEHIILDKIIGILIKNIFIENTEQKTENE